MVKRPSAVQETWKGGFYQVEKDTLSLAAIMVNIYEVFII